MKLNNTCFNTEIILKEISQNLHPFSPVKVKIYLKVYFKAYNYFENFHA